MSAKNRLNRLESILGRAEEALKLPPIAAQETSAQKWARKDRERMAAKEPFDWQALREARSERGDDWADLSGEKRQNVKSCIDELKAANRVRRTG